MTVWTDFIKQWAQKHNVSYGCAMSNPDMKAAYYKAYPKTTGKKKGTVSAAPAPAPAPAPTAVLIRKARDDMNDFFMENHEDWYNEVGKLMIPKRLYSKYMKDEEKRIAKKYGLNVRDFA